MLTPHSMYGNNSYSTNKTTSIIILYIFLTTLRSVIISRLYNRYSHVYRDVRHMNINPKTLKKYNCVILENTNHNILYIPSVNIFNLHNLYLSCYSTSHIFFIGNNFSCLIDNLSPYPKFTLYI